MESIYVYILIVHCLILLMLLLSSIEILSRHQAPACPFLNNFIEFLSMVSYGIFTILFLVIKYILFLHDLRFASFSNFNSFCSFFFSMQLPLFSTRVRPYHVLGRSRFLPKIHLLSLSRIVHLPLKYGRRFPSSRSFFVVWW